MKLFNLELKDNDPMKLASEIRALFHDIEATGVKVDLQLTAFIKALYPTYSHYLESLQASEKMKDITFDNLLEKIAVLRSKGRHLKIIFLDMTLAIEVVGEDNLVAEVAANILSHSTSTKIINTETSNQETSNLCNAIDVEKWVIVPTFVELLGRRFVIRRKSPQTKVTLLNLHTML